MQEKSFKYIKNKSVWEPSTEKFQVNLGYCWARPPRLYTHMRACRLKFLTSLTTG